jgi:hypothetical protein
MVPGGRISAPGYEAAVGKYEARIAAEVIDVADVGVFWPSDAASVITTVGAPGVALRDGGLEAGVVADPGLRVCECDRCSTGDVVSSRSRIGGSFRASMADCVAVGVWGAA